MVFRILFVCMLMVVVGCVSQEQNEASLQHQEAVSKMANQPEEIAVSRKDVVNDIIKHGVYFYQVAETAKFYVPADIVFEPFTSQWVNGNIDALIKDMALLISSYDVVQVDVASSIVGAKSKRYLNAIARRQAERVAGALVGLGVDARIVTSRGVKGLIKVATKGMRKYFDNSDSNGLGYIEVSFKTTHKN